MVEITWLGHGTFQLKLDSGEVLVLDPWTDGNPSYPQGHTFSRVDAILISHGHFDHIHDAVPLAKRFGPKVVCIYEIGQWLEGKGVEKVSAMNKGGTQQVGFYGYGEIAPLGSGRPELRSQSLAFTLLAEAV